MVKIKDWLGRRLEKRKRHRALLALTDDQLQDIGLARSEVHGEIARRFWD